LQFRFWILWMRSHLKICPKWKKGKGDRVSSLTLDP
jgi:hypothetical protein